MLDDVAEDRAAQPVLLPGAPVDVQDEFGMGEDDEFVVNTQPAELQGRILTAMPTVLLVHREAVQGAAGSNSGGRTRLRLNRSRAG